MDRPRTFARCWARQDTRCAGYYMRNPLVTTKQEGEREGDEAPTTCDHLKTKADAVLLSGVPAPHLLKLTPGSTIVRKREAQTCGWDRRRCHALPFKSLATGDEFYECSITGSERPWCYTTAQSMGLLRLQWQQSYRPRVAVRQMGGMQQAVWWRIARADSDLPEFDDKRAHI